MGQTHGSAYTLAGLVLENYPWGATNRPPPLSLLAELSFCKILHIKATESI